MDYYCFEKKKNRYENLGHIFHKKCCEMEICNCYIVAQFASWIDKLSSVDMIKVLQCGIESETWIQLSYAGVNTGSTYHV